MARPRVFISSTFYDLQHIRTSLEGFVERLGFEAVLSDAEEADKDAVPCIFLSDNKKVSKEDTSMNKDE